MKRSTSLTLLATGALCLVAGTALLTSNTFVEAFRRGYAVGQRARLERDVKELLTKQPKAETDILEELYGPYDEAALPVPSWVTTSPSIVKMSMRAEGGKLWLEGEIGPGDGDRLASLLTRFKPGTVVPVSFNSGGGSWRGGTAMAAELEKAKGRCTATRVGACGLTFKGLVDFGSRCASSCISVFATMTSRYVAGRTPGQVDGQLIVHTMAQPSGETEYTKAMDVEWVRMLDDWGVPHRVTGKLIATSSRSGAVLDADDLREWGVTIVTMRQDGSLRMVKP